jgi:hypothetical protein
VCWRILPLSHTRMISALLNRLMSAWPNPACSGVGVARELKRFLLGVKWMWIARKKSVDLGKNILGFKNPTMGGSDPAAAPLLYVGEYNHLATRVRYHR